MVLLYIKNSVKKNYDQVAFLEETQMCYLSTATVIVSDSRFRS